MTPFQTVQKLVMSVLHITLILYHISLYHQDEVVLHMNGEIQNIKGKPPIQKLP